MAANVVAQRPTPRVQPSPPDFVRAAAFRGGYANSGASWQPGGNRTQSAGWAYCGLRVVRLEPGASLTLATGEDELAIVPLSGGSSVVEIAGQRLLLVLDNLEHLLECTPSLAALLSTTAGLTARERGSAPQACTHANGARRR